MSDQEKIVISKPVASRPHANSRSFSALIADPSMDSGPASSSAEKTIAIKPKTTRFRPVQTHQSAELMSCMDDVSESVSCYFSENTFVAQTRGTSSSNITYKPTAKLAPTTSGSLLGDFDPSYHQASNIGAQEPANVIEQAKLFDSQFASSHQQGLHSQVDMLQVSEHSNSMHQSTELTKSHQQSSTSGDRPSYDGYNWRKYGQKQVKGSDYPRSYYKCTDPNCPVKKKVERTLDGQIAEIVYKGEHNHPKPQPPKRASSGSQGHNFAVNETKDSSASLWSNSLFEVNLSAGVMESHNEVGLSGNPNLQQQLQFVQDPLIPVVFDDTTTHNYTTSVNSDSNKINYKRRRTYDKVIGENRLTEGAAAPQAMMQASSESDISGDGFHWRKYGQKVVKGNTYPRSYYRCTYPRCNVRKYVERVSDDSGSFVTTYEGKHNHETPARANEV